MADLDIDNQHDFYKEVRLDEEGKIITTGVEQTGELKKAGNAYNFYKDIALDENGNIKVILT